MARAYAAADMRETRGLPSCGVGYARGGDGSGKSLSAGLVDEESAGEAGSETASAGCTGDGRLALEVSECGRDLNEMLPVDQSIDGLWRARKLCPRTAAQDGSRRVTKKSTSSTSPDGNRSGRVVARVRIVVEPSRNRSVVGGIGRVGIACVSTNTESRKQCVAPESMRARRIRRNREEVMET